ncbi:unnamed protein product [Owenia fusiformis]|uniref:Uncharacterized protein n=1 Tax=Owenia fusiformis TaxID=6347 RepID=A0A8S4PM41_OWEFU|nr:unnamed protein product [Owenia fusiformis]
MSGRARSKRKRNKSRNKTKGRKSYSATPSSWDEDDSSYSFSPPTKQQNVGNDDTFSTPMTQNKLSTKHDDDDTQIPDTQNSSASPSLISTGSTTQQNAPIKTKVSDEQNHINKPTVPNKTSHQSSTAESLQNELLLDVKAKLIKAVKEDLVLAVRADILREVKDIKRHILNIEQKLQVDLDAFKQGALAFEHKINKQVKEMDNRMSQLEASQNADRGERQLDDFPQTVA